MGQRDFNIDLGDAKSLDREKLAGKMNYGFKLDLGLILLSVLIVCTAYVLTKLT